MDDLLSEFISETRETLEALGAEIVAWEAAPDDRERLDSIFRFVHTVKGSCGFLDMPRLEKLSHAAEDVLADVRAGRRVPDARLVNAVLGIIDRISELTEAMETGAAVSHHEDAVLIAALSTVEAGAVPTPQPVVAPTIARPVARSIRLPVELLDRMMGGISDLVLARNELARKLRNGQGDIGAEAAFDRLSQSIGDMRDAITRTRMARIDNLFSALPRLVRDLSAELAKLVQLEIDGGDVELDREMIEMIRDPLTHIVRNAIDHGLELAEDRARVGKPATGRLRVSARQSGNRILIEVADDGRGIDPDRLVAKAIAQGTLTPDQAAAMGMKARLELIFAAGLSTAEAVTAISGRGVGMDVVRANLERIGGTVEIDSRLGQGLRLTLSVPLTLTIIPALTIGVGALHYAIPRSVIEEIVRVGGRSVAMERMGNALVASIRGRRLPVVQLDRFLGIDTALSEGEPQVLVVVRAGGGERYALSVDRVFDHEELVVKPAAPAIMAAGIFAGTTLPDNSRPMLLLDVAAIAAIAGVQPIAADEGVIEDDGAAEAAPTLLFRDLDGRERAIRLALVERIEDVPAAAISHAAGRLRLTQAGQVLALASCGAALPDDRVRILRLSDGSGLIAYAIDRVIDIVPIAAEMVPAAAPGPIAGVLPFDGRAIELLDPFWLFAEAGGARAPMGEPAADGLDRRPLCLLADASDPWTRQVLGPLVTVAGYRVRYGDDGDGDADADVVIASSGGGGPASGSAPVLRLRRQAAAESDGSIYRYDRAGLLDALRSSVGGRR